MLSLERKIQRWTDFALEHESVGNQDIADMFWAKIEATLEELEEEYVLG